MSALLANLVKRNPTLGGVVMASKGDEWFYLEWLAKKNGRQNEIIRLRPRLVGEPDRPQHRLNVTGDARLPFTTRARILVDTAAALNPKDEKGFFRVKGAAHIGRAFELLADIGRPVTATNAYDLLTSERELKAALDRLTDLAPPCRDCARVNRLKKGQDTERTQLDGLLLEYDVSRASLCHVPEPVTRSRRRFEDPAVVIRRVGFLSRRTRTLSVRAAASRLEGPLETEITIPEKERAALATLPGRTRTARSHDRIQHCRGAPCRHRTIAWESDAGEISQQSRPARDDAESRHQRPGIVSPTRLCHTLNATRGAKVRSDFA